MFNLKRIVILVLCLSLFFGTVGALASCNKTPTKDNGTKTTAPFTAGTPSESTAVSTFNETAAETTGPNSAVTETTGPETTAPVTTVPETTVPVTTVPETTVPETTVPETTVPETTAPETTIAETTGPAPLDEHSPLYIPYVSQDSAILYYNEVVLDAEFVNGGNASLVQKWTSPITYYIYGTPTIEDLDVLNRFTSFLNTIEGFPGITPSVRTEEERLSIYFCSYDEMINRLGNNYAGCDGGVVFWYNGANQIYDATICIRTDIDQYIRNSVILEEIYNGLGPVQDTNLRPESLIYSGFSTPQWLHPIDELILKLLYHPTIKCGMTAEQCKTAIQSLYY